MSINLKTINIYKEQEPYDVDVDNRPLLDIQDNIIEIINILESSGCYSEIAADPSSEPAGGFSPFTCACVYSNSLLIPINIAKPISEIDYSAYPLVLVLNYFEATKTYGCISFSANIKLSTKFASFVPGSEGRLLNVGPGGELVDQVYYDLAHASKGYQALYVGKILTTNSISFGGNQVSILGNNYYLAKNRNDTTSGLTTVQRGNSDSNIVFKAININQTGSVYNFAEFVNTSSSPYSLSEIPIPVYFSSTQLSYDQSTGIFTSPSLETYLNEVHFATPTLTALTNSNQAYLTAGVNVRSLLDFNATNLIHSSVYSNNVSELTQPLSTKLVFTERSKVVLSEPDYPVGFSLPNKTKSIGVSIQAATNQPDNIVPTTDTSGVTFGDFYGTGGAYFGGILDNSLDPAAAGRPSLNADQASQTVTSVVTSNIITDYSDGFTLLLASKSATGTLSNLALQADGYINLSSTQGILTNAKTPKLDLEITSKYYVDALVNGIKNSDANKIPLTGTTDINVTGSVVFDVAGNVNSNTNVLTFTGVNYVDIASYQKIRFLDAPGSSTFQSIYVNSTPGTLLPVAAADILVSHWYQISTVGTTNWMAVGASANTVGVVFVANISGTSGTGVALEVTPSLSVDVERFQAVNKEFLGSYVTYRLSSGTSDFVTKGDILAPALPQTIYGNKTFTSSTTIQSASGVAGLTLVSASALPIEFTLTPATLGDTLTIGGINPVLLDRETLSTDSAHAIVTKSLLDSEIAGITSGITDPFFATWLHKADNSYTSIAAGGNTYACSFSPGSGAGSDMNLNFDLYFTSDASGIKYIGINPIVVQVNAGVSWGQNLGDDQYRVSCHILVNGTPIASSFDQFDGPKGFSSYPTASVSAVFKMNHNDILVAGGRMDRDLSNGVAIQHYFSMAKIG